MARNPFADIIKLPLEVDIDFDAEPYHRAAADLQVQPLIPIQISEEWLLIPRIVATAINYVPDVTRKSGGTLGRGSLRTAEQLMRDIFDSSADHSGENGFRDDVTILVVKCNFDNPHTTS